MKVSCRWWIYRLHQKTSSQRGRVWILRFTQTDAASPISVLPAASPNMSRQQRQSINGFCMLIEVKYLSPAESNSPVPTCMKCGSLSHVPRCHISWQLTFIDRKSCLFHRVPCLCVWLCRFLVTSTILCIAPGVMLNDDLVKNWPTGSLFSRVNIWWYTDCLLVMRAFFLRRHVGKL